MNNIIIIIQKNYYYYCYYYYYYYYCKLNNMITTFNCFVEMALFGLWGFLTPLRSYSLYFISDYVDMYEHT